MRIKIMREVEQILSQKTQMTSCPTALSIKRGRWLAEIVDPVACASTINKMPELGPEARANLARHLETTDEELRANIIRMRKRSIN